MLLSENVTSNDQTLQSIFLPSPPYSPQSPSTSTSSEQQQQEKEEGGRHQEQELEATGEEVYFLQGIPPTDPLLLDSENGNGGVISSADVAEVVPDDDDEEDGINAHVREDVVISSRLDLANHFQNQIKSDEQEEKDQDVFDDNGLNFEDVFEFVDLPVDNNLLTHPFWQVSTINHLILNRFYYI